MPGSVSGVLVMSGVCPADERIARVAGARVTIRLTAPNRLMGQMTRGLLISPSLRRRREISASHQQLVSLDPLRPRRLGFNWVLREAQFAVAPLHCLTLTSRFSEFRVINSSFRRLP